MEMRSFAWMRYRFRETDPKQLQFPRYIKCIKKERVYSKNFAKFM